MKTIFTKSGAVHQNVISAIGHCRFDKTESGKFKCYYCKWQGSYKHRTLSDYSDLIMLCLKLKRCKYSKGNDAPRGGVEGNYLLISKTAYRHLMLTTKLNNKES